MKFTLKKLAFCLFVVFSSTAYSQITNVALNKSVQVDSHYRAPENTGEMAVDGIKNASNQESRWVSAKADDHYIAIDLDTFYYVSKVNFYTGYNNSYQYPLIDYQVQYWDGASWVDMVAREGNQSAVVEERFDQTYYTDQIRLNVTKTEDGIVRLYEIEVYGSLTEEPTQNLPAWMVNGDTLYLVSEDVKVGIGTPLPDATLTVNGQIHATEVKVDLKVPVPDYVFADGYKGKDLSEVELFIQKNHHLPYMASAAEIEKDGLLLAENQMNLLRTVEEMMLYQIAMQKQLQELQKANDQLQKELAVLKQK